MAGIKGFHRNWIKLEYLNPLMVIIHLITCEGKFSVFKSCHLHFLAHFIDHEKYINFPYYFLKSHEKMSNHVKKKTANPKGSLYHHILINILILDQLKE